MGVISASSDWFPVSKLTTSTGTGTCSCSCSCGCKYIVEVDIDTSIPYEFLHRSEAAETQRAGNPAEVGNPAPGDSDYCTR